MNYDILKKIVVYIIAVALIITSFIVTPPGVVDPSSLCASALIIGGYEWLFGHSIKSVHIDKTGIHIETHDK